MRTKILAPLVALCFFISFPVAASRCPYHWCMAGIAAGEALIYTNPAFKVPVRIAEGGVVVGLIAYAVNLAMSSSKSESPKDSVNPPEEVVQESK